MSRLIEIQHFVRLKTSTNVKIVRGLEYLEACAQAKTFLTLQPSTVANDVSPYSLLFPGGVMLIVATDVLLSENDLLPQLVNSMKEMKVSNDSFDT